MVITKTVITKNVDASWTGEPRGLATKLSATFAPLHLN